MHWTYDPEGLKSRDLQQGDVLSPSGELLSVLRAEHPRFADENQLAFLVTTQSCDLVRRSKGAKAHQVALAGVYSLATVATRLLEQVAEPVGGGCCRKSSKEGARQFLARLFDQNEQALGLFYLHPPQGDPSAVDRDTIGEPAVAFLRSTVSITSEHYDILVAARAAALTSEFRAKLGWLAGNLYARAATKDWADASGGKKIVGDLIKAHLKEQEWVDDACVEAALVHVTPDELKRMSREQVLDVLEQHKPVAPIEDVADAVNEVVAEVLEDAATEDVLRRVRNRIRSHPVISKRIRKS